MNINSRNNYSNLFSSIFSTSSNGGGMNNFLADYASIKNGSYGKLMKAYYARNKEDVSSTARRTATYKPNPAKKSVDSAETLNKIKKNADDLKASADTLLKTGSDSVFESNDKDALFNAVSSFVNNYNAALDSAGMSDTSTIQHRASMMVNATQANKNLLEKIGINLNGNRLSIDEETFRSADVNTVKSLFNDNYSYGNRISSYASYISNKATAEGASATTSTASGSTSSTGSTSTSKDSANSLTTIKDSTSKLKESADALLKTGSASVFESEKEDALYNAVSSFITNYNSVVDAAGKSNVSSIQQRASMMANTTQSYKNMLEKIGITVDSGNKLSIDKTAFQSANKDTVKTLFNENYSYADRVSSYASYMNEKATSEAAKANTYSAAGSYTNNYNTGSIYNDYF